MVTVAAPGDTPRRDEERRRSLSGMNVQAHEQLKNHIWDVANRLRGPYRPPQYRLVMLPMVTQQLARALSQGTPIVITTIQKFPFISQALSTLESKGQGVKIDTAGKRFAVIVDEAHSSQSGETATALKEMLNKAGIESAIAAQLSEEEDDDLSEEAKAAMLRDSLMRARQPNLSFFAFTATPKFKTKVLFDEPGPTGSAPFHEYSMRQAIEEGFIMDVLRNYTTYKRFFGLIKQVENDPEVPRKKTAKALTRYLELHPVNIDQVVSVIVEHFRLYVMHELGGRAKAMVVTGSRLALFSVGPRSCARSCRPCEHVTERN